jgi:sucrose phosphorylase
MTNSVELITYSDRLAPDIAGLTALIDGPLRGLFGGVHLLPFFVPIDGVDAGFDPDDHRAVDPRVGTWEDLERLSERVDVTADLIVNHISTRSEPFRDYAAQGSESASADMFLTFDKVFPEGASEQDLLALYRPRPGLPFTERVCGDGVRRMLWTTFTAEQLDLDLDSPLALAYLDEILGVFEDHRVSTVRLDAVGYAVKRAGTSCFMIPETFAFIDRLTRTARAHGLETLVEVHGHHRRQIEIASEVDLVYDFALPPLVLHALFTGDAEPLADWIEIRPQNCVTVLDTHDGIGVVDVASDPGPAGEPGLLNADQIDELVEGIHDRSNGQSRLASGGAAANVDLYQVNCTFFDALGRDDHRYLLARLIQLLLPGRSQIYYVGLLAGGNDMELLAATGVGRDINRHRFSADEIDQALRRPVVRALCAAVRLRASHPAFAGVFSWSRVGSSTLVLRWERERASVELTADLAAAAFDLVVTEPSGSTSYPSLEELASSAT